MSRVYVAVQLKLTAWGSLQKSLPLSQTTHVWNVYYKAEHVLTWRLSSDLMIKYIPPKLHGFGAWCYWCEDLLCVGLAPAAMWPFRMSTSVTRRIYYLVKLLCVGLAPAVVWPIPMSTSAMRGIYYLMKLLCVGLAPVAMWPFPMGTSAMKGIYYLMSSNPVAHAIEMLRRINSNPANTWYAIIELDSKVSTNIYWCIKAGVPNLFFGGGHINFPFCGGGLMSIYNRTTTVQLLNTPYHGTEQLTINLNVPIQSVAP